MLQLYREENKLILKKIFPPRICHSDSEIQSDLLETRGGER